ncbi:hypothetical protein HanIR_Chr16g0792691 [Helianthus annuus]|nr:hypothetical protein HanIR_Chr16g0792691 [Helianthus annuus]
MMCLRLECNAGMRTSDSCRIEAEPGSRTRNKGIREVLHGFLLPLSKISGHRSSRITRIVRKERLRSLNFVTH